MSESTDRDLIVDALENTYKDACKYADGIIVIDRDARLEFIDLGAQKILGVSRSDALGSGLDIFLPKDKRHMHKNWIDKEYAKLDEALKTKSTYKGKIMGASINSLEPRYLSAQDFNEQPISIGLEFQPLFWGKQDGFAGFISRDPSQNLRERAITQSEEAEKAVKNKQVQLGLYAIDETGKRFSGGYYWLKENVFNGWPGSAFLSFAVMGTGTVTLVSIILLATGVVKLPKAPTPQHFNIGIDEPTSPSLSNGEKSSPKRNQDDKKGK